MLDKKKILEMYAYYFEALKGFSILQTMRPKMKNLKLQRGVIQRAYKEIKELKLEMKLVEFLSLVDSMYIFLLAKEYRASELRKVVEIIEHKIDKRTTDNFTLLVLFSKTSGELKESADLVIKKAYENVYGETLKAKDLKYLKENIKEEPYFLIRDGSSIRITLEKITIS